MLNCLLLLSVLSLLSVETHSTACTGPITLTTTTGRPGGPYDACTSMSGLITIAALYESNSGNVEGLAALQTAPDGFRVINTKLTTISMPNLLQTHRWTVEENSFLQSLSFPNMQSGAFRVNENPVLETISLSQSMTVSSAFIERNPKLQAFKCCNTQDFATSHIWFIDNPEMTEIDGWNSVTKQQSGMIRLTNNAKLATVRIFSSAQAINSIYLLTLPSLTSVNDFTALTAIEPGSTGGSCTLQIQHIGSSSGLPSFPNLLEACFVSFKAIVGVTALDATSIIPKLQSAQNLDVEAMPDLASINNFAPALVAATRVKIDSNPVLQTVSGFTGLTVGTSFQITNSPVLQSFRMCNGALLGSAVLSGNSKLSCVDTTHFKSYVNSNVCGSNNNLLQCYVEFVANSVSVTGGVLRSDGQVEIPNVFGGQTLCYSAVIPVKRFSLVTALQPNNSPGTFSCTSTTVDSETSSSVFDTVTARLCCTVTAGFGKDIRIQLTLNGELVTDGVSAGLLAYPPPSISPNTLRLFQVQQNTNSPTLPLIFSTSLQTRVQFEAQHLPTDKADLTAKYGAGSTFTFTCEVVTISTTLVSCLTEPFDNVNENFNAFHFQITAGGQSSAPSTDLFSFPIRPRVTSVTGCPAGGCPTSGNTPIVIDGANLYLPLQVLISSLECTSIQVLVQGTRIQCHTPSSAGLAAPLQLASFQKFSTVTPFAYAAPTVTSVSSTSCTTRSALKIDECAREGGFILTINGQNFGVSNAVVLVGSSDCSSVTHVSATRLHCTVPPGFQTDREVRVFQGNSAVSATNTANFGYAQCARGFHQQGLTTNCTQCVPGKYMPESFRGRTACLDCTVGTFSGSVQASVCTNCLAGSFADAISTSLCKQCGFGEFASKPGASTCFLCDPGEFANATGSTVCRACPVGTASAQKGTRECPTCFAPFFQTESGRETCLTCPAGRYQVLIPPNTHRGCATCPKHLLCAGGEVVVPKGQFAFREKDGSLEAYECLPGTCLGGSSLEQQNCSAGRVPSTKDNPLCGQCLPGYAEWGGTCVECSGGTEWLVIIAFLSAIFVFVIIFHISSQFSTGTTKIFVYYIQNAYLFTSNLEWSQFIAIFSLDPVSATGDTCVADISPENKLLLSFVFPSVAFVFLGVICLGHYLASFCSCKNDDDAALTRANTLVRQSSIASLRSKPHMMLSQKAFGPFQIALYVRSLIAIYLFSVNVITTTVFEFFDCVDVGDNSFVRTNPAVSCFSNEYEALIAPHAVLLVATIVLIPGALLFIMRKARNRPRSDPRHIERTSFRKYLGVLSEPYKTRYYYWGVLTVYRRTSLVAAAVLLTEERRQRLAVLIMLNVVYLSMHLSYEPYGDRRDNFWESVSLNALTILVLLQTLYEDDPSTTQEYAIGGVMVLFSIILALRTIQAKIYHLWLKIRGRKERTEAPRRSDAGEINRIELMNMGDRTQTMHSMQRVQTFRAHPHAKRSHRTGDDAALFGGLDDESGTTHTSPPAATTSPRPTGIFSCLKKPSNQDEDDHNSSPARVNEGQTGSSNTGLFSCFKQQQEPVLAAEDTTEPKAVKKAKKAKKADVWSRLAATPTANSTHRNAHSSEEVKTSPPEPASVDPARSQADREPPSPIVDKPVTSPALSKPADSPRRSRIFKYFQKKNSADQETNVSLAVDSSAEDNATTKFAGKPATTSSREDVTQPRRKLKSSRGNSPGKTNASKAPSTDGNTQTKGARSKKKFAKNKGATSKAKAKRSSPRK